MWELFSFRNTWIFIPAIAGIYSGIYSYSGISQTNAPLITTHLISDRTLDSRYLKRLINVKGRLKINLKFIGRECLQLFLFQILTVNNDSIRISSDILDTLIKIPRFSRTGTASAILNSLNDHVIVSFP